MAHDRWRPRSGSGSPRPHPKDANPRPFYNLFISMTLSTRATFTDIFVSPISYGSYIFERYCQIEISAPIAVKTAFFWHTQPRGARIEMIVLTFLRFRRTACISRLHRLSASPPTSSPVANYPSTTCFYTLKHIALAPNPGEPQAGECAIQRGSPSQKRLSKLATASADLTAANRPQKPLPKMAISHLPTSPCPDRDPGPKSETPPPGMDRAAAFRARVSRRLTKSAGTVRFPTP